MTTSQKLELKFNGATVTIEADDAAMAHKLYNQILSSSRTVATPTPVATNKTPRTRKPHEPLPRQVIINGVAHSITKPTWREFESFCLSIFHQINPGLYNRILPTYNALFNGFSGGARTTARQSKINAEFELLGMVINANLSSVDIRKHVTAIANLMHIPFQIQ